MPNAEADATHQTAPVHLRSASFAWPGGRGVSDVDLTVRSGEIVALLGPNGAGKSTILKMLSGEISPQQGEVSLFGMPHGRNARRRIGLVLQEPSTDDLMTPRETLELHGRLFGLRGQILRPRSSALLDSLGIGERADDRCETLSGGLRRRLDISRALLHEPDLLLLDEPTLSLDPESSEAIWQTLHHRAREGVAVMVCSNDTTEVETNAHRVVFVDDGQIVADDAPSDLTSDLLHDALELDWLNPATSDIAKLESWDDIGSIVRTSEHLYLTVEDSAKLVPRLFQHYGSQIAGIRIRESNLRDAWFQIVGRPLNSDARTAND